MSPLVKLIKWLETLNGGKEYPWWVQLPLWLAAMALIGYLGDTWLA